MKICKSGLGVFLFLLLATGSHAETITLKTASGKLATADYLGGDNLTSPILLLHGFLQTRQFPTVSRLATSLHELGYTVLNPTLSLGLSNRNKSLPCEAIHIHSLDTDANELQQWVDWLWERTGRPVTLIGHSAGGPIILKYMEQSNARHVKHSILISLSYYASGPVANETREQADRAIRAISANTDPLEDYSLSYCQQYPTYASAFLSYYNWDKDKVISVASRFRDKTSIIIGTGDRRIDSNWLSRLEQSKNNIIPVEGADHFFDQAYELDLLEIIENLLTIHSAL